MTVNYQRVQDCFSKAAASYYDDAVMQNQIGSRLIELLKQHVDLAALASSHASKFIPDAAVPDAAIPSAAASLPTTSAASAAATAASAATAATSSSPSLNVLEIGCGPGNFTTRLLSELKVGSLCLNDLSLPMLEQNLSKLASNGYHLSSKSIACYEQSAGASSLHCRMHAFEQGERCCSDANAAASQAIAAFAKAAPLERLSAICADARLLYQAREQGDLEQAPFDLIVSNASFQWFDNLPLAIQNLARLGRHAKTMLQLNAHDAQEQDCRAKGSVLAFSSFYAGHFEEIRELTGVSLNYLSKESVLEALDCLGFETEVFFEEEVQYFASSKSLFKHLHDTGVNAISDTPLGAGAMRRILREYDSRYRDANGVRLTWHPYYVIAKL